MSELNNNEAIEITEPLALDSTLQTLVSAVQDLSTAVQPTNVYVDIATTLSVSGWSSATPSVFTWTNNKVTDECAVEVFFATGASSAPTPYIEYEKGINSVVFYAPTGKPTVDLPVVIRIINAEAEIASNIDATMVSTDAISGSSNVQQALGALNTKIVNVAYNTYKANLQARTSITIPVAKPGFVICSRVHSNASLNVFTVFAYGAEIAGKIIDSGNAKDVVTLTLDGNNIIVTNNHSIAVNIQLIE